MESMITYSILCLDPSPSRRWGHTMCMVSETEGILIGGQGDKSAISKDAVWLLNLGNYFLTIHSMCIALLIVKYKR